VVSFLLDLLPITYKRTLSAHLLLLDLIILIILGEEQKARSSSLCNFLHPPVTPCSKYPPPLFSYIFSLCSSLNIGGHVSHPNRTTGKIIVLYILIFKFFWQQMRRQNVLDRMVASITKIKFPLESNFDLLLSSPNIWTVTHFQTICLLCLYPNFDLHSGSQTATYTYFSLCLFLDQPSC
jgi:hypothetical protein